MMIDISPVGARLQVLLNEGLIVREVVECSHQTRQPQRSDQGRAKLEGLA